MTRLHSRLRIVHVGKYYPPRVGGIETHLHDLCSALRETADVRVLVANDKRRDEEAIIDGVAVSRLGIQFNIAGAPVCTSMVWKLKSSGADLVHVHLPNPAGILAVMASGYRGRIVATWHSDVIRQRRLARFFAPIQRRFLRNCAAVIATSPEYAHSSADLQHFKDRVSIIPYGIDAEQFRQVPHEKIEAIRRRDPRPLLLAVGRLVYYKGFEYLIRSMAQLDARLILVGDGPLRHSLEREARELGVIDRVEFLGEMQPLEIAPYYHACDLFVLPSIARSEAFGIVQLEAMACGKPVVNTRLASGVPFVSLDGVTGITVAPSDPNALRVAIERLLGDAPLRNRYGAAASRRVDGEFSIASMVTRTRDLYERVLSAPHGHRAVVNVA